MSSSQGQDASASALRAAYDSVHVKLSPSHARRLMVQIGTNLRMVGGYRVASLVLGYLPMGEELDVRPFLKAALQDGKTVALPRVEGTEVVFAPIADESDLEARRVSRREGGIDGFDLTHSICLVPGLVFDAEGYRVAYGAGYLDNFLADYPGLKVGVVRGFNISSNPLPHDEHDVPVDVLVSESAVWSCRR